MKAKRFLALVMCLVMGIMMVPMTARADGEKEYTVILSPGEGTGDQIILQH